ncbi:hypothetical protein POM88_052795 [Heracleum sosnowskyi]|uniref:Uncharacterized protein n=1 Tax=Heracleum sosnowskyi TaxID=360622 RepID=A0AAD8GQ31_9APIA|nr:hypothetical protein POM88_052795 [Heracleum sosnowskyi]
MNLNDWSTLILNFNNVSSDSKENAEDSCGSLNTGRNIKRKRDMPRKSEPMVTNEKHIVSIPGTIFSKQAPDGSRGRRGQQSTTPGKSFVDPEDDRKDKPKGRDPISRIVVD